MRADGRTRVFVLAALALCLLLAGVVANFASPEPDGLEQVSEHAGFADRATEHPLAGSPVADYQVRAAGDGWLATSTAGVLGVLGTFALATGVFALVGRRRPAPR